MKMLVATDDGDILREMPIWARLPLAEAGVLSTKRIRSWLRMCDEFMTVCLTNLHVPSEVITITIWKDRMAIDAWNLDRIEGN